MRLGTGPVQSAPPGKRPAGPPLRRGTVHVLPVTCWTLEFRSVLCLPVRFGRSPQPSQTLLGGQTKRPGVWAPAILRRSRGCKLRPPIRPSRENPRADISSAPALRGETGLREGREQPSRPASRGRPGAVRAWAPPASHRSHRPHVRRPGPATRGRPSCRASPRSTFSAPPSRFQLQR